MVRLFENLRSVKWPNLSGIFLLNSTKGACSATYEFPAAKGQRADAHPSWKSQSFIKNGGQQKRLDKALHESAVVKIQNHLIWAIAFSTKILILATLLVVDTSDHHFFGCTSVQIHFKYKFRFYIQTMIYHHCHPEFLTSRSGVVPP